MLRIKLLTVIATLALLCACSSPQARRTGMLAGTGTFIGGSIVAGAGAATMESGDAAIVPAAGGVLAFTGLVVFMISSIPPSVEPRPRGAGAFGGTTPAPAPVSATVYAERCDNGDADGCFLLGEAFWGGTNGVRNNPAAACAAFDASCAAGDERGCDAVASRCP